MATIFPQGEQLLSAPFDFEWADVRQGGPNSPGVYVDGVRVDFTTLVGGEVVTLSRGSTTQAGVPVIISAPGGGPGTKTVVEVVADINAVFGLAAGKPTDFAYVWQDAVRLRDRTVGPNVGLASCGLYNVGVPQGSINNIGLPYLSRSEVAAASTTRVCSLALAPDDTSNISSNFFSIPQGTRKLGVVVTTSAPSGAQAVDDKKPSFTVGFSDQSTLQEPPYHTLRQIGAYPIQPLPGLINSTLRLTDAGSAVILPFDSAPIFGTTPFLASDVLPDQALYLEFAVPLNARRVRVATFGCFPSRQPFTGPDVPTMTARAWAIG